MEHVQKMTKSILADIAVKMAKDHYSLDLTQYSKNDLCELQNIIHYAIFSKQIKPQ